MKRTREAMRLAGRRGNSPVLLVFALLCFVAVATAATAQIVNIVTATGEYEGSPVTATATESVTVSGSQTNTNSLTLAMTATVSEISRGQAIPYLIKVTNPGPGPRTGVQVVGIMPPGLSYIEGSGAVAGVPTEPAAEGRQLEFSGIALPAGTSVELRIHLVAGAAATAPEFVATSFARDMDSGSVVSNTANVTVRLRTEPVFDCSDIIGRVYEDRNRDGYYQDGEPGIGGVRLATVTGLLVTTDERGRYSIACPYVPDDGSGSNFIVKLDERTLPQGFTVTSENPSTVRLTRGKLAKLDFGSAGPRLVEFDLDDRSFEPGSVSPTPATLQAMALLLNRLSQEKSRLRITYRDAASELSDSRLSLIEVLIRDAWEKTDKNYQLQIESRRLRK
jgi:uncharacterized repeat protein (TIGR01451 family)